LAPRAPLTAVVAAGVEVPVLVRAFRPDYPDAVLTVLADGGMKDVALVVRQAKWFRPAGGSRMPGEYLATEFLVRLPGDPHRSILCDGERRIVVLAVGRAGDRLRSGNRVDQHVAVQQGKRTAAAQVAQADVECALRRRDADGRGRRRVHGDGDAGGREH